MPTPSHRRSLLRRFWAVGALAVAALVVGLIVGGVFRSDGKQALVEQWAAAWGRKDYAAMYTMVSDDAAQRASQATFTKAYEDAAGTSTETRVTTGKPMSDGDGYELPVVLSTAIFGHIRGTIALPVTGTGDQARIDWSPSMVFPGLHPGETLHRTTEMPPRASLLTRDGTPLAQGPARTSTLGPVADAVVGNLGPVPADRRAALKQAGIPLTTQVGLTGLERIFDSQLLGTPGGRLTAGIRTIAYRAPVRGRNVRTTISTSVETAAIAALGTQTGGVVAVVPQTGEILAFAGIPFSGLQPPGSTFKMVTATAALEGHVAGPNSQYPYATSATVDGVTISNANGESCGGTLTLAFAVSCNSVFVPLGVKIGAKRLVDTAEAYGFNKPTGIPGAAISQIPDADKIGDDVAVGSSAIGQGEVLATTLQMTRIATTIALGGRLPELTLDHDDLGKPGKQVVTPSAAKALTDMMIQVVAEGTGHNAQIPGVTVAGKTGTAELKSTVPCQTNTTDTTTTSTTTPTNPESCSSDSQADDPTDTDAWFASFAPASHPRVAVGVMFVADGAGGDTAAPAAKGVLEAALQATAP